MYVWQVEPFVVSAASASGTLPYDNLGKYQEANDKYFCPSNKIPIYILAGAVLFLFSLLFFQ